MRSHQAGNAILIILIAVFLFGALAAVFMRGARTGQINLTSGQSKLIAQELLDYAGVLERTSLKLTQRGCAPSQLSYVGLNADCSANPLGPNDNSCNVMHANGGGISAPPIPTSIPNLQIRVSGGTSLEDIGTWDSGTPYGHQDLVVWFINIPLEVCMAMDRIAGNTDDLPDVTDLDASCFGIAGYGGSLAETGNRAGKKAACINTVTSPSVPANLPLGPSFYYVIYEQ